MKHKLEKNVEHLKENYTVLKQIAITFSNELRLKEHFFPFRGFKNLKFACLEMEKITVKTKFIRLVL